MDTQKPKVAKIGLGVVTYNRPKYLNQTWKEVEKYILPKVDYAVVYNDGSTEDYSKPYKRINKAAKTTIIDNPENHGVAVAKNAVMQKLLDLGCDYIFVTEDDILPTSPMVIPAYLAAHRMSGIDHLMFAHHGDGNSQGAIDVQGPIVWWPASVGAFTFYTREVLERVGLMDENFVNAFEHVEHSWRIMKSHNVPYGYWPDVMGSESVLKEIPGSIDNSSIGKQDNPKRIRVIIAGLNYWKQKDPDFPAQHTLDYYNGILTEMIANDIDTTA